VCLPRLDPRGFLHAHVTRLSAKGDITLAILSQDREAFSALSAAKAKIAASLSSSGTLDQLVEAAEAETFGVGAFLLNFFFFL
jgi:hypothetical protein